MRSLCRRPLWSLLFACLLCGGLRAQLVEVGDGGPGPVKAQHLTAELVSLAPAVSPGGSVDLGLVLTLEEKWHVYWVNAGDSGEPPQVKWTLPPGVTVGPMQFAVPGRLPLGPLMDFGYEDTAVFPFELTVAARSRPGPIHLDARVSWLVCKEVCIPGKAHLGFDLNVAPGSAPGARLGALGTALKNLPEPLPERMKASVRGGKQELVLTLVTGTAEEDAEVYPYDPDQIVNAADQGIETTPDGIRVRLKRAPESTELPKTLHLLVKLSDSEAYELTAPVTPGETAATSAPGAGAGPAAAASGGVTVAGAIGLAFLGGMILNLMPCVFPVLFLKGLALVQSSTEERARLRAHGLVYTLGILVSFWIIVGVLLLLRAGGSHAGWGFQLQSPAFIAVLASFLFFFALSLAGQFDLGLSLTSAGDSLTRKSGYTGSFFTGVLATVVATPCTAPLMGAAIGFALAQSAVVTFAVFTALGLGLALPYLLLSLEPAWTRILPRPGAWMEVLKQLTAVPLFGTAIWLVWVYGRLYAPEAGENIDHIARLLWGFLVLAVAGWLLGRWPAKWGSAVGATALCLGALAIPLTQVEAKTTKWAPYTEAALTQARAAGHPVFVDFTAAWCLSCQVNEKAVLQAGDVDRQLRDRGFVLLRADWTRYDPAITAELGKVGRSGVPTYVLYPAGPASPPDVLPELLTKGVVLDAIAKDTK